MVLKLRRGAPDWVRAKCLGTAPLRQPGESELYDPWFDEEDPSPVMDICNGDDGGGICPIREACLHFAATNNERFGVWGGMSEGDRKLMRKLWRWRPGSGEPRPEWHWYSPEELQAELRLRMKEGSINMKQLEAEDEDNGD